MTTRPRRTIGLLGATLLAVTASVTFVSPVEAAPGTVTTDPVSTDLISSDPRAARAAAEWALAQRDGDGLLRSFGGPSLSLTLELGTALAVTGGFEEEVAQISELLDEQADDLTATGTKSAPLAKALAFTVDAGIDAEADGVDLQGALEGMVVEDGINAGRIDDGAGGYASTWTQVWAVKGLVGHDSAQAPSAVDYLAGQQCPDGWLRDSLADGPPTEQQCASTRPGVDTTALAVATLAPFADQDPDLEALVTNATEWLLDQQQDDGGFVDPFLGANANTTGLAGWALHAATEPAAASRAALWLRRLQVGAACDAALGPETGAIAYNADAFADARGNGIGARDRAQWIFVAVQALPGLIEAPAAVSELGITGLPRFVKAGKTIPVTLTGVAPGEQVCLTGGGQPYEFTGPGSVKLPTARGTGSLTLTLTTADRGVSVRASVLDRARLTVDVAKKKVKKGKRNRITVRGLAAGEKVKVKLRGKRKARGVANGKGVFRARFKVGKKTGKAKIRVVGQFPNRTGASKFRVR